MGPEGERWKHEKPEVKRGEERVEERKVDEKRRGEVQGCLPSKTEGAPLAYEV